LLYIYTGIQWCVVFCKSTDVSEKSKATQPSAFTLFFCLAYSSILKMDEPSDGFHRTTLHYMCEDGPIPGTLLAILCTTLFQPCFIAPSSQSFTKYARILEKPGKSLQKEDSWNRAYGLNFRVYTLKANHPHSSPQTFPQTRRPAKCPRVSAGQVSYNTRSTFEAKSFLLPFQKTHLQATKYNSTWFT
jgi:hypothetical protein